MDCLPSTALLDLGNIELQQAVEPCDELLAVCRGSLVSKDGGRDVARDPTRTGRAVRSSSTHRDSPMFADFVVDGLLGAVETRSWSREDVCMRVRQL